MLKFLSLAIVMFSIAISNSWGIDSSEKAIIEEFNCIISDPALKNFSAKLKAQVDTVDNKQHLKQFTAEIKVNKLILNQVSNSNLNVLTAFYDDFSADTFSRKNIESSFDFIYKDIPSIGIKQSNKIERISRFYGIMENNDYSFIVELHLLSTFNKTIKKFQLLKKIARIDSKYFLCK